MASPDTGDTSAQKKDQATEATTKNTTTTKADTTKSDKCSFINITSESQTPPQEQFVKGKLRPKLLFWAKELNAPNHLLEVIKNGYKLPFIDTPVNRIFRNNKAALENNSFVSETIADLLKDGSVVQVEHCPQVVSPLSVSTDRAGKKRLILDLRYVNQHLYKERVSFDDWKTFENFVTENGVCYKFDLKKGYHHVEIFEDHQQFLGFSWGEGLFRKYYVFTVLPFGLSTAPMLFTKLLRPLVSLWHQKGINICVFLDDGAGTERYLSKAIRNATYVKKTLEQSGFVANTEKSIWNPTSSMIWLGIHVDFCKNVFTITKKRITYLREDIEKALRKRITSARKLSKLVGSIISTQFVLGDITSLKTRYLYKTIEDCTSWDAKIDIIEFPNSYAEIKFWKDNLVRLNQREFCEFEGNSFHVASDASSFGLGAVTQETNLKTHKNLNEIEKTLSSTWRELQAIVYGIRSFKEFLRNRHVSWSTDNYAATIIVKKGSNKDHLQLLALEIYELCVQENIRLALKWIPREMNKEADEISKYLDTDDWRVTDAFFEEIDSKWGPHTVDRFANRENTKLPRFNSKFHSPDSEHVDTFSTAWNNENNLLVPPVKMIPRVLKKLFNSPTVGSLVVPLWKSQGFWAMLNSTRYKWMVKEQIIIENGKRILQRSEIPFMILTAEKYKGAMIALRMDSR